MKLGSKYDLTFTSSSPCQFLGSSFLIPSCGCIWIPYHSEQHPGWSSMFVLRSELGGVERVYITLFILDIIEVYSPFCSHHITMSTSKKVATSWLPTTSSHDAVRSSPSCATLWGSLAFICLCFVCAEGKIVTLSFNVSHPSQWHGLHPLENHAPCAIIPGSTVQLLLVSLAMWFQACWWLRASASIPKLCLE